MPGLTVDPVPDCKPPGVGSIETPPGWHGLRYAAPSYIHYYNRRSVLSCTASGAALVSGIGAGRPGAVIRSSVARVVL